MDQSKSPHQPPHKATPSSTTQRVGKYTLVGIGIILFNYALYAILANLIINNNDLLWLSNFIATAITTIVAYFAHSRITWKERTVTKHSVIRFFIWNAILTVAVAPGFTQLFSFFTPLYDLTYNICINIHLPSSYEFILTTGAFVLTSLVIMILNFLLYDKFVFGKTKTHPKNN